MLEHFVTLASNGRSAKWPDTLTPGKVCRVWRRQELPGPVVVGCHPAHGWDGRDARPDTSNCSELFVAVGGLNFGPRSH